MNSIQKEQILRVNCPGFGEENYFSVGKAKSLDSYKVIIVNPVSIFHLFDNDLSLQKEIDNDLADGLTSRAIASDSILQSIQEDLKTRRILELVSFLEKGGLLIYYLCRPFLVQGDNIAVDNYSWLESLAPDSSPDDNIRHMSAVSHGRVVEVTAEGELSEFAPYFSQVGLEWNTIIRQDFLTDGYKALATAGPKKCIAAQLVAGDSGGRIVFLPAPYSPDFDKKLVECIEVWNVKNHGSAVQLPAAEAVTEQVTISGTPEPKPVLNTLEAAGTEPQSVGSEPYPVITTPAPVAEPQPEAFVIATSEPLIESAEQVSPVISPVLAAEPSVLSNESPVGVAEAAALTSTAGLLITPPPPAALAPALAVNSVGVIISVDPLSAGRTEATQNLVREMELLAQANPSTGNSSSYSAATHVVEPALGLRIGRGLFFDDDDDCLDIGSPAFNGQTTAPQIDNVEAQPTPVLVSAPIVTPVPIIEILTAASESAANGSGGEEQNEIEISPLSIDLPAPLSTDAALRTELDVTQDLKAPLAALKIENSIDLDAIEAYDVSLQTQSEEEQQSTQQSISEEPALAVQEPVAEQTSPITGGSLPGVSPLASLPIEVLPMPEVATAGNGNGNGNGDGNGNGNGHHLQEAHENVKTEEIILGNSLISSSDVTMLGADSKLPEAKDLIKKMEEISKSTNCDLAFDIVLPQTEELRKKRLNLLDSIKQAQAEIANVENKMSQIEYLKNSLLRGEGEELIAACQRILTKLGWNAQPSEKSEQELYLLASDKPQAITRIVRSTAQAKRPDIAELGESVCSFWGEHEIEAKGLMLTCTWADRGLSERREQDYTDGLAQFAQKKGLCLMTTLQLLYMYRDVELGRLTSEEARSRILETNGRLAGFQIESPLVNV